MPICDMPEQQARSPWLDRDALPKLPTKHVIAALLALLTGSVGLAFLGSERVAWVILAVLFAYTAFFVRIPSTVTMALVTAVLTVLLFGSVQLGSAVLSLTVSVSAATLLLTAGRSVILRLLTVLIPCAASVAGILLHGDGLTALLAVAILPAALLMTAATLWGQNRTRAVCLTAGGFLLAAVALIGYLLWQGSTGAGMSVGAYVQHLQNQVLQVCVQIRDELIRLMAENNGTEMYLESLEKSLTDTYLSQLITEFFVLTPGLLIAFCAILAYQAHSLLNATYYVSGLKAVLTPRVQVLTMSVISAVLYVVATCLYLLIPGTGTVVAVAGNVCIMLLPGFGVVGARALITFTAKMKQARALIVVAAAFLLCCNFVSVLYMLSLWGASGTVTDALHRKLMEKINGGEDNDGE